MLGPSFSVSRSSVCISKSSSHRSLSFSFSPMRKQRMRVDALSVKNRSGHNKEYADQCSFVEEFVHQSLPRMGISSILSGRAMSLALSAKMVSADET